MNQLLSLQSSLLKNNNNNFFAPTSAFWELLRAVVCDTLPPAISGAHEPGLLTRVHLIAPPPRGGGWRMFKGGEVLFLN